MDTIQELQKELHTEAHNTRKMLNRVPDDLWSWKPHQKSMTLKQLSVHLAELPSWISLGLNTDGIDFAASPYEPTPFAGKEELLQVFEQSLLEGTEALNKATETDLQPSWTMRSGEQIHGVLTRYEVIRHALAQTIHHRAQLGVYLRLLDIPIPGTYGPSADDGSF